MDEVIAILSQVAKHGPLDRVDGSSDLSAEAVAELIETGYLRGTKVGTLEEPHAFLNVRITTPGRECLKVLLLEQREVSPWRRAIRSLGTAAGRITVGVAIGLILFFITVAVKAQTTTGAVVCMN